MIAELDTFVKPLFTVSREAKGKPRNPYPDALSQLRPTSGVGALVIVAHKYTAGTPILVALPFVGHCTPPESGGVLELGSRDMPKMYPPKLPWHLTGGSLKRRFIFQMPPHSCHVSGRGATHFHICRSVFAPESSSLGFIDSTFERFQHLLLNEVLERSAQNSCPLGTWKLNLNLLAS